MNIQCESGYSSSSSEDDGPVRRPGPPPPMGPPPKKKKRPRGPPQKTINKIWARFSVQRPSKALYILPASSTGKEAVAGKDGVAATTTPVWQRGPELLTEAYERAADECRRKVRKIIQECRRVNMRYRDPGWDLDWDLKMEKGHCLNGLGIAKFDLSGSKGLTNPTSSVPKAVKRVHEIFEKPTFLEKVSPSDVKQGNLGDCWLIASLAALANCEDGIRRICVEWDTKIGIYGFVFYRDGEWIYSIIDDKLYLKSPVWDSPSMQRDLLQQIDREDVERVYRKTYQTGSKALYFAQCKDQNETWLPLIEKAYAKAHNDYAALQGGWIGEGLEDLTGGVTTELLTSDILDTEGFWENELSRVNEEFLFGCSTGLLDGGYGDRDGISEGHAYVIMEARTLKNGTRLLKLRNPWGKGRKGNWEGAWSDGSKEWTTEVKEELGHTFGSDSVFWIAYEDLLRKYQHFDRTRLFRDPDWRCCQRWIGVEVPWKPQYNEKFVVKLTKESPLVLVLCQLDDRYFKGLRGQYSFRLQFRLHERSRPGAEDYIVRSHGNYLMDRSVSVELPSMPPGEYSVFLSVAAERDVNLPSVEEVVRRECRRRSENEKLAQVGMAYDLAHAKAAHHLEQVARARRKAEAKKASESRKKERRRAWEKRHLQKDILRRQEKKNEEKREKRKAEEEAKRPKDKSVQTGEPDDDSETKKDKATQTEDIVAKTKEKQDKNDDNDKDENVKDENHKNDNDTKDKDKKDGKDKDAEGKDAEAQDKKESDAKEEHADSKGKESADADAASDSSASAQSTPKSTASKPATPTLTPSPSSLSKGSSASRSSFPSLPPAPSGHRASYGPVGNSDPTSRSRGGGHHGPPPPAPGQYPGGQQFDSSDSESSASPISDWEECYSSDDMAMKPRLAPAVGGGMPMTTGSSSKRSPIVGPPIAGGGSPGGAGGSSRGDADSDEDDLPEPWNAVCVVGFRVYCKDPDLEVRVVMEGGELEEGGMGERGAADLDNAQANAAGGATGDAENGEGSEKKGDGKVNYDTIVNKGEEEDKKGGEGGKTVEMKEGGTQTDAGTAAATVSELDKKPETVLTAEPTPDGKGAEAIVPGVTPGLQTRPPAASCTCGKAQGSAESAAPAAADDDDYVKNSTAPSASPLSTPGNVTPSSSSHPTPDTTPVAGSGRSDGADPELYGS